MILYVIWNAGIPKLRIIRIKFIGWGAGMAMIFVEKVFYTLQPSIKDRNFAIIFVSIVNEPLHINHTSLATHNLNRIDLGRTKTVSRVYRDPSSLISIHIIFLLFWNMISLWHSYTFNLSLIFHFTVVRYVRRKILLAWIMIEYFQNANDLIWFESNCFFHLTFAFVGMSVLFAFPSTKLGIQLVGNWTHQIGLFALNDEYRRHFVFTCAMTRWIFDSIALILSVQKVDLVWNSGFCECFAQTISRFADFWLNFTFYFFQRVIRNLVQCITSILWVGLEAM